MKNPPPEGFHNGAYCHHVEPVSRVCTDANGILSWLEQLKPEDDLHLMLTLYLEEINQYNPEDSDLTLDDVLKAARGQGDFSKISPGNYHRIMLYLVSKIRIYFTLSDELIYFHPIAEDQSFNLETWFEGVKSIETASPRLQKINAAITDFFAEVSLNLK